MIPREREIKICSSGVGRLIILNGVLFVSPIKVQDLNKKLERLLQNHVT